MRSPAVDHRHRLLEAMSHAVARQGYAAVTIADLAAAARVSKRSFYEQFAGKAECFTALYEAASRQAFQVLREAIDPQHHWHDQVEQALTAYLGTLAGHPTLLSTLFIDIMALGPPGLAARRRSTDQLADLIMQLAGPSLDRHHAVAIIGGVHEWVLQAVERQQVAQLPELASPAARLVRAVVSAPN